MRLYVKHPDASLVVAGGEQYPVKKQVVDVPEQVGASLLLFDEYELYDAQVALHEDFVKADEEATAQGLKAAEELAKEQAAKELAAAKEAYENAQAEADRLKAAYDELAGEQPKGKGKKANEPAPYGSAAQ